MTEPAYLITYPPTADSKTELEWVRERYRLVCFALCERMGIKPDEIIADSGEEAWMLVGYLEGNKMLRRAAE
jgi:hypothetical protein